MLAFGSSWTPADRVQCSAVGTTSKPRVRARVVHEAIAAFDRFADEGRDQVRELVPEESWRAIMGARPLGWVPIEHDRHVPAAFVEIAGEERAHVFFRSLLVEQLRRPLLRSTVAATVRMLGLSPASMARAAPVGWDVIYRDFGRLRVVQRGPQQTSIVMDHVAQTVFDNPAYMLSFRGFFAGLLDVCEVEGNADIKHNDAGRWIETTLSWTSRDAAQTPLAGP